jgi:hypothetical protein
VGQRPGENLPYLKTLHLENPFLAWLSDHTCCRYFGNRAQVHHADAFGRVDAFCRFSTDVPSGTRLQIDDVFLQEPFADLG